MIIALIIALTGANVAHSMQKKTIVPIAFTTMTTGSSAIHSNIVSYNDGAVITLNKWDTGLVGASAAFTPVWIAASSVSGQLGNKLYRSIWLIQAVAAYAGASNQCLWIWVPWNGDVKAGGYSC